MAIWIKCDLLSDQGTIRSRSRHHSHSYKTTTMKNYQSVRSLHCPSDSSGLQWTLVKLWAKIGGVQWSLADSNMKWVVLSQGGVR